MARGAHGDADVGPDPRHHQSPEQAGAVRGVRGGRTARLDRLPEAGVVSVPGGEQVLEAVGDAPPVGCRPPEAPRRIEPFDERLRLPADRADASGEGVEMVAGGEGRHTVWAGIRRTGG